MSSLPKDDFLCRWTIDQIGTLDEHSFTTSAPSPGSDSYTISLWFYAERFAGTQVLANQGLKGAEHAGWSIFLQETRLLFRLRLDSGAQADIYAPIITKKVWHHFVGVIDQQQGRLFGYLDGSEDGWTDGEVGASFIIGSISPPAELIIGGYTDPAGGHFDHTFGRQGSGRIDDLRIYSGFLSPKQAAAFVDSHNQPPNANFSSNPTNGEAPLQVNFDARASSDVDGVIKNYIWDFGDGTVGSGPQIDHQYRYAGKYKARLTVLDDDHGMNKAESTMVFTGEDNPLRFNPVFINGVEGYGCYRIPSIVRAANGDLVAFAEGRVESCSDSTQTIRAVCKRSSDNGKTWSKLQVLAKNIVNGKEYVIHNISPVVDTIYETGKIIAVYNKAEFNEWELVRGRGVEKVFCIYSDDHGKTWHDEIDITTQVHKPYNPDYTEIYPPAALPENQEAAWKIQSPMLGHAVQLEGTKSNTSTKGRLFFSGVVKRGDGGLFYPNNYAFWSDDLGESWQIGGMIDSPRANGSDPRGLGEATAVELENGGIMINSRNYLDGKPFGCRAITIGSFDLQGNISFKPTYHDHVLIEPTVQASIIRYTHRDQPEFGGRSRILFSNPNHPKARYNLTVRLSYDEGKTWPVSKVIDPGPSAYSDLVIQNDMKIGVLYERGNQGGIYYVNFPLEWITDERDSLTL